MTGWKQEDGEAFLGSLEQLGMRLGLERMQALCAALGKPQERFASAHVVGTNGKSSTTEMAVRLLHSSGIRVGGCVSPHTEQWSERVLFGAGRIEPDRFAVALQRVSETITIVERNLDDGDRVSQFEAAVAASFLVLADAEVEVAVIEAGLGGRLDATNVIPSRLTALTSIGLDHTAILGSTTAEIAAEKLAVLRPSSRLLIGDLDDQVLALAEAAAAERECELRITEPLAAAATPEHFPPYLRRNAGMAVAIYRGLGGPELPAEAIRNTLGALRLPGRAELLDGEPPLILDAAHNAAGAAALAEALPGLSDGRPVFGCFSVLAEKDHAAIAAAIAPKLAAAVCTAIDPPPGRGRPGARAVDPKRLARDFKDAGLGECEVVAEPERAVARTLDLAKAHGGVALLAGSHYLLPYSWIQRHAQNCSP